VGTKKEQATSKNLHEIFLEDIMLSRTSQSKTESESEILSSNPRLGILETITFNSLDAVRNWLDKIEIHNANFARFLSKVIPAQCPFERDLRILGRKVAHIPPLCKLNPFYDQLTGLRFRALCYLVDECGEVV